MKKTKNKLIFSEDDQRILKKSIEKVKKMNWNKEASKGRRNKNINKKVA